MSLEEETGRYLISFDTQQYSHLFTDIAIVGSGIAGLSAAIQAAQYGDVLIITKDRIMGGSTLHAQGGIAVVMRSGDSFERHIADTLQAGHGLSDPKIISKVIREGPPLIEAMIEWGAKFDKEDGELHFTREGGHSSARVIHAFGDSTGLEISRCLSEKAQSLSNVRVLEHTFVIDLLEIEGRCAGLLVSSQKHGYRCIWAKQTILASGGCGQVFRETTNPSVVTGDGLAVAYRAGAKLQDMEFVQFHPTTLYVAGSSRSLITEAVRGEGGILINQAGERFLEKYHPQKELAPRDVVSLAIEKEMKDTRSTNVFLDVRHIPKTAFLKRFPRISDLCKQFDIDIAKEPIPVRPSQHYLVGGIQTDENGLTTVPNLYACGEVACTNLHGANRLASNSLLEGLVFGHCCGDIAGKNVENIINGPKVCRIKYEKDKSTHPSVDLWDLRNSLRTEMWRQVAIERNESLLLSALEKIKHWTGYAYRTEFDTPSGWETQNMLAVAWIITLSALTRRESRGVHFRQDYPKKNDEKWLRHIVIGRGKNQPILL